MTFKGQGRAAVCKISENLQEKKENSQSDQVQDKDSNIINKPTIFNSIKKKK